MQHNVPSDELFEKVVNGLDKIEDSFKRLNGLAVKRKETRF